MTNNDIVSGFDDIAVQSLKFILEKIDDTSIAVHLNGYIDTYNSLQFQNKIRTTYSKYKNIIFNMSAISYLSSTGLGSFVNVLKELKAINGRLVLYAIQPKVYEVFNLLGFSNFFDITDGIERAKDLLFKKEKIVAETFPKIIECPSCNKKLKVAKSGKFRCPQCKMGIGIDAHAGIHLL